MRTLAIKHIKNIDSDNIFSSADYRKELNLKTLSEKNGYEWLAKRSLNKNTVESSPRFWFDLAEIMPRDSNQVDFSFALVETLLESNINDLEKSFNFILFSFSITV